MELEGLVLGMDVGKEFIPHLFVTHQSKGLLLLTGH